jgi:hypothetical protein
MDRIRNIYAKYGKRMVTEGQNTSDVKFQKRVDREMFYPVC